MSLTFKPLPCGRAWHAVVGDGTRYTMALVEEGGDTFVEGHFHTGVGKEHRWDCLAVVSLKAPGLVGEAQAILEVARACRKHAEARVARP